MTTCCSSPARHADSNRAAGTPRNSPSHRRFPFDPEKVWSYEAGIKVRPVRPPHVRANLTVFQLDVSDLQILAGLLNTTTGALTFLSRNFADYRNRGVEAEFSLCRSTA